MQKERNANTFITKGLYYTAAVVPHRTSTGSFQCPPSSSTFISHSKSLCLKIASSGLPVCTWTNVLVYKTEYREIFCLRVPTFLAYYKNVLQLCAPRNIAWQPTSWTSRKLPSGRLSELAAFLGMPDVPILRAVFRVPPGYMAGHTFVPLFETFGLH
jgi:hypothetical protein